MRKLYVLLVLSVSLIMLFAIGAGAAGQGRAGAVSSMVIDVRTEAEWNAGHLEGAVLIPHDRIEQEIAAVAPDKKTRLYLYCRSGRRTGLAFEVFRRAGYEAVINLGTMENASRELRRQVVR